MHHRSTIALTAAAFCLCASARAQLVVKPEAEFNGVSPNGLRFRIKSAQAKDAVQIKAEPIHASRSLLGFRVTFENRTHQDVAVCTPELGITLTISLKGARTSPPNPALHPENWRGGASLRPRPSLGDVSAVTIPASGQEHFDFSIDVLARQFPEIRSGSKVKVTFVYDDRYANGEEKRVLIGSRRLGTFAVRWIGGLEYR